MECNKEEAVRAKDLAERKMQEKDFAGARKMILKAQQLFPDLENISQMLTVCEVHCSSSIKVNGETDWYGILQVEATADELSIKKQYRKLALLLHPDKNKFSGAEAAFKLIGEAHMTLTDQAKRSLYDVKRRATIRTATQPKRNAPATNNFNPVNLNGRNHHQQQASGFAGPLTFWTICPNCGMKYQYFRSILKKALRCQHCLKPFIAFDLNEQAVPSGENAVFAWNSSRMPQKFPAQQPYISSQHADRSVNRESEGGKTEVEGGDGDKVRFEKVKLAQMSKRAKEVKQSKVNSAKPASKATQKRGRKLIIESSDSESANSEESEEPIIDEVTYQGSPFNRYPRRSSRQKHNVTYNEADDDDDNDEDDDDDDDDEFVKPHNNNNNKRQRENESSCHADENNQTFADTDAEEINTRASDADISNTMAGSQKGVDSSKDELLNGNGQAKKGNLHEENLEMGTKMESKPCSTSDADAHLVSEDLDDGSGSFSYPDPEFFDFEINRVPSKFAVDQVWAVYDDRDGMPRFYARIKHVFASQFKVYFTWLEFDPKEAEMAWYAKDLPVACGIFRPGKSEMSDDIKMFSHIVTWAKGKKRNTYEIYPRKGDVWASFKGWDIGWSSDADSHGLYEYEVVEVLSDFVEGTGIVVVPLVKIKGFVSLFMQSKETAPYVIPSSEILRFSHAVPVYRMTGKERAEVPEGTFELDPASLPPNSKEAFPSVTLGSDPMTTKKSDGGGSNGSRVNFKDDHASTSQYVLTKDQPDGSPSDSASSKCDYPDSVFYKFSQDKSIENFEGGQIWALYSDLDELPKYYALIKKVEVEDGKIHAKWLEACPQGEKVKQCLGAGLPLGCGIFEVTGEVMEHESTGAFSHHLQVRKMENDQYEILPRASEIWAVYKNWRAGWNLSNFKNCEYFVVEISKCTALAIEATCLTKVEGYAAVFMKDKKVSSPMVITKDEFLRFSHRIPAFRLTNERGGKLCDCWELDPESLPSSLLYTNLP